MAETTFGITYSGEALKTGRMPVADLAPALLALGRLLNDASLRLYPDRPPPSLEIKATEDGSFMAILALIANTGWDGVLDVFNNPPVSALLNLERTVFGKLGVLDLVRRLHGKHVTMEEPLPESGSIRLTIEEDKITFEAPATAYRMVQNIEVRKQARRVVAPLESPGVESVSFKTTDDSLVIDQSELPAYELPEADPEEINELAIPGIVLEIVSPVMRQDRKWQFATDENDVFWADIADHEWWEHVVDRDEAFRFGDLLRCDVRIVQTRTTRGLSKQYTITRVIERLPPMRLV